MIFAALANTLLSFCSDVGYNLAGQTKPALTFGEEYEHRFGYQ